MKRKNIKYLITSLVMVNCLSLASEPIIASASSNLIDNNQEIYAHKDKAKGFDIFSEENYKYLSSEQKKELKQLKKCKDKGELSEDQKKTLLSLIDCIILGKLGDKNYADYKSLAEKNRAYRNLTEDESKRLREYTDIIDGTKPTGKDILDQFLR